MQMLLQWGGSDLTVTDLGFGSCNKIDANPVDIARFLDLHSLSGLKLMTNTRKI